MRETRFRSTRATSVIVLVAAMAGLVGCPSSARDAREDEAVAESADACRAICRATRECSSTPARECREACDKVLSSRVRDGLATAIADCAAPRIRRACGDDGGGDDAMSAAIVRCIDEAGRDALANDDAPMRLVARALCGREARCSSASRREERTCVGAMVEKSTTTEGFGFFGALKPELVDEFATCISDAECEESSATEPCFHRLVGLSTPARPSSTASPPRPLPARPAPRHPTPKPSPPPPKHEDPPDLRGTPI
jgi:hypothetical protein